MFVGKAHKVARMEHILGLKAPALLANFRLGWKGLPRTNTLAYY